MQHLQGVILGKIVFDMGAHEGTRFDVDGKICVVAGLLRAHDFLVAGQGFARG